MIAMHYGFDLPDDFDMPRVRERVAQKGPAFDRYPGMAFKAFLADERRGVQGRNFYGAFYVWNDADAARDFLLSPQFASFVQSFGRPEVRLWPVVAFADRDLSRARSATLDLAPLPLADGERSSKAHPACWWMATKPPSRRSTPRTGKACASICGATNPAPWR
jgi:hypothetical protein